MSTTEKKFFSDRDKTMVIKWLTGGAAVGGTLGLITALSQSLKDAEKESALADNHDDDDTITIYKNSSAGEGGGIVSGAVASTMAVGGGLLSAALTYDVIRRIRNNIKLRKAKQRFEDSQAYLLNAQGYTPLSEEEKIMMAEQLKKESSSKGSIPLTDLTVGSLGATPLILMIASGALSGLMLDKFFPTPKPSAKQIKPKRVRIVDAPSQTVQEMNTESRDLAQAENMLELDGQDKEASYRDKSLEESGIEFLVRNVYATSGPDSDLRNVVNITANGHYPSFEKTAREIGFDNALNTIKGTQIEDASPLINLISIGILSKSASLKNHVGLLAAVEFADKNPQMFKHATSLPQGVQDNMAEFGRLMGVAFRMEMAESIGIPDTQYLSKEASEVDEDALVRLIASATGVPLPLDLGMEEDKGSADGDKPDENSSIKIVPTEDGDDGGLSEIPEDVLDAIFTPGSH